MKKFFLLIKQIKSQFLRKLKWILWNPLQKPKSLVDYATPLSYYLSQGILQRWFQWFQLKRFSARKSYCTRSVDWECFHCIHTCAYSKYCEYELDGLYRAIHRCDVRIDCIAYEWRMYMYMCCGGGGEKLE